MHRTEAIAWVVSVWEEWPAHQVESGNGLFGIRDSPAAAQESGGEENGGEGGWLRDGGGGWRAFGNNDEKLTDQRGGVDDAAHFQNFIDCVKSRNRPNADLEMVGHPSSVLCHAGNVAWRTGGTLTLDAETDMFVGEGAAEANRLRTRPEYRKPWTLPEV